MVILVVCMYQCNWLCSATLLYGHPILLEWYGHSLPSASSQNTSIASTNAAMTCAQPNCYASITQRQLSRINHDRSAAPFHLRTFNLGSLEATQAYSYPQTQVLDRALKRLPARSPGGAPLNCLFSISHNTAKDLAD